jgi:hypothetical protein
VSAGPTAGAGAAELRRRLALGGALVFVDTVFF